MLPQKPRSRVTRVKIGSKRRFSKSGVRHAQCAQCVADATFGKMLESGRFWPLGGPEALPQPRRLGRAARAPPHTQTHHHHHLGRRRRLGHFSQFDCWWAFDRARFHQSTLLSLSRAVVIICRLTFGQIGCRRNEQATHSFQADTLVSLSLREAALQARCKQAGAPKNERPYSRALLTGQD